MGIEVDNHLWVAVAGASFARQVHDRIAEGHGPPDGRLCDIYLDEAEAIADIAMEARMRASARRAKAGR
jgi:hypothetical protein